MPEPLHEHITFVQHADSGALERLACSGAILEQEVRDTHSVDDERSAAFHAHTSAPREPPPCQPELQGRRPTQSRDPSCWASADSGVLVGVRDDRIDDDLGVERVGDETTVVSLRDQSPNPIEVSSRRNDDPRPQSDPRDAHRFLVFGLLDRLVGLDWIRREQLLSCGVLSLSVTTAWSTHR